MFVSIVFNTEYMDIASRKMWYLKNLFHCKENGWILITQDYLKRHFVELQDSINERFFNQFEMRHFTLDEVKDVEQYFVPDEVFDDFEKACGSRTEMLFELSKNTMPTLDKHLHEIFSEIQKKHPDEKIDGIIHCLEGFESVRKIADELNCPLINYSFAAFRKPHGYRQTLYHSNIKKHYWDASECEERYNSFLKEDRKSLPVFTNEEIISIIGKEHTLPLIKLINSKPKYEMGICCECNSLLPQVFKDNHYTDDDIIYECKKLFGPGSFKVRSHAAHLDDIQVDRSEVHNDPASFILSCKRLTAVQSQILLKVLLWKRPMIMKHACAAFSYLSQNDMQSLNVADIVGLNYYIFGYLIPSELMFSDEYWKWRLTNPSEVDIYWKHLDFLFKALGIEKEKAMQLEGKDRFRYLLDMRNCDKQLKEDLLNDEVLTNINWDVPSSRFEIVGDKKMTYWRLDKEKSDGTLETNLFVKVKDANQLEFYPLNDVAGFARIIAVSLNGKNIRVPEDYMEFKFMPKVNGHYIINLYKNIDVVNVTIIWQYKKVFDYLNESSSIS